MQKWIFVLLLTVLSGIGAGAQTNADEISLMDRFRNNYNRLDMDSIYNMFSARTQGMVSKDQLAQSFKQVYEAYGQIVMIDTAGGAAAGGHSTFKAVFEKGVLNLLVSSSGHKFDGFRFAPATEIQKGVPANFEIRSGAVTLKGVLTVPSGKARYPVVLLIAGSGPTDRDGNSAAGLRTNAYQMLADSLQRHGIACLRYDKRGVGDSRAGVGTEESVTFDSLVYDATVLIRKLKTDRRFSQVIVAGHSEGALIGILASQIAAPDAFISIAGAGRRAGKLLREQLAPDSMNAPAAARILDSLEAGHEVAHVPDALLYLLRPSVQPYLASWLRYDPAVELAHLNVPTLILQGDKDLQVKGNDAEMLKEAAKHGTYKVLQGMNHVLKTVSGDDKENLASYTNPAPPLHAALVAACVAFINK